MKALASGIEDPATQASVRRIEKQLNQKPEVTGSTDAEKLASLIQALARAGYIVDRTE